jgi:hypothetical protein
MASGLVNLHSDSFRVLLAEAYAVGTSQDDAQFLADVLALITESSGTGYARLLLTNAASGSPGAFWQQSGPLWTFFCDDVVWDPSDFAFQYAIFYDDTPAADAAKPLIGFFDYGELLGPSGGPSTTLPINASGLFTFTSLL